MRCVVHDPCKRVDPLPKKNQKQHSEMAQRLEQTQAAVQTQQLSSMQVAVAKLVELPITELATRVRDEMVDRKSVV